MKRSSASANLIDDSRGPMPLLVAAQKYEYVFLNTYDSFSAARTDIVNELTLARLDLIRYGNVASLPKAKALYSTRIARVSILNGWHMRRLVHIIGTAALIFLAAANAGAMTIRVERPDWFKALMNNSSWYVVLDGEIDAGTPARVAEALRRTGMDGVDVYINSPGGNLLAGMEIGRMIRQSGANTYIGGLAPGPSSPIPGVPSVKSVPGVCYSACALAFLGGVYRYASNGSEYGVHRFSSRSGPTGSDLDTAQIISAAIGTFIREMEVDPGLFDLMVQEGKDKIRILSKMELMRLNVVNNGRKRPVWSIEVVEGAQYLRGMQDNVYGQGKAILLCYDNRILYQSHYQAGTEMANSIASGGWFHSLLVDDKTLPLPEPARISATGNEIYTVFALTSEQALAIASSSSMGHAMQRARDAPVFVGYQIDIPGASSGKVHMFIRNCLRR